MPRTTSVRAGAHPGVPSPPAGTPGGILSEAWRPGAAEPVAIHVRPEVVARLQEEAAVFSSAAAGAEPDPVAARISLVVDDRIPAAPGYEIHRAPPLATRRPA